MKMIVGLGNPGKEYKDTRHNIGFMALDLYASKHQANFSTHKLNGEYTIVEKNKEKILLLKPQTYMNLSGEAVSSFAKYYKIDISDILIISDDLDMEFGKIKLKPKGSSGGHNGLKNIEHHLHTNEYKRLKIGIAKNKNYETKDYVLGKIPEEQREKLNSVFITVNDIIDDFSTLPFEKLMSKYNKKWWDYMCRLFGIEQEEEYGIFWKYISRNTYDRRN